MRNCAVSEMIKSRWTLMKLSGTTTSPLPDSVPRPLTAFSISDGSCTSAVMGRTLSFAAASMNGREKNLPPSGTEFASESWGPQQHPRPWHFRAGGGAVHSIKSGLTHRSKKAPLLDQLVGEDVELRRDGHAKRVAIIPL